MSITKQEVSKTFTSLSKYILNNNLDKVKEEIAKGADVNVQDNRLSLLAAVVINNNLEIANLLLKNGASPYLQQNNFKFLKLLVKKNQMEKISKQKSIETLSLEDLIEDLFISQPYDLPIQYYTARKNHIKFFKLIIRYSNKENFSNQQREEIYKAIKTSYEDFEIKISLLICVYRFFEVENPINRITDILRIGGESLIKTCVLYPDIIDLNYLPIDSVKTMIPNIRAYHDRLQLTIRIGKYIDNDEDFIKFYNAINLPGSVGDKYVDGISIRELFTKYYTLYNNLLFLKNLGLEIRVPKIEVNIIDKEIESAEIFTDKRDDNIQSLDEEDEKQEILPKVADAETHQLITPKADSNANTYNQEKQETLITNTQEIPDDSNSDNLAVLGDSTTS